MPPTNERNDKQPMDRTTNQAKRKQNKSNQIDLPTYLTTVPNYPTNHS